MPRLRVSPNRHYLMRMDGGNFFYMGDTGWELFQRLDRNEAAFYLETRSAQGFNVIQAVLLAQFDGLRVPNAEGALPLIDQDPAKPNEKYFEFVDFVVKEANKRSLFMGLLPTWGDKLPGANPPGEGPEVFTPENAYVYGKFLGSRYKDADVIWIIGGDRPVSNEVQRQIWHAMARGLREGDGHTHLITFHPRGGGDSALYFKDDPDLLDFNMAQSGHGPRNYPNYKIIERDWHLQPTKPAMDGEPRYEHLGVMMNPKHGRFDAADIRQALYWATFAGGCGVTYGCNEIWQFYDPKKVPPSHFAITPWQEALHFEGATQVKHLRALYEKFPFRKLAPTPELVLEGQSDGADHVEATCAHDGSFAFCYIPQGKPLKVDLSKLASASPQASWYNPRTGEWQHLGPAPQSGEFTPPSEGRGNDWVLVLDCT